MEALKLRNFQLPRVNDQTSDTDDSSKDSSLDSRYDDIDNELSCEYREDIWNNLLEQETNRMVIHLQSPQLEFRGALVCQLRTVCTALKLGIGTLHSAVSLLDLFMDAHRLRCDRLSHVALACLSLAAKSEEKFSRAPNLKTLSKVSGIKLCSKIFRQLEWMVGQHVKWRLLAPTPASYAALLAQYVITKEDFKTKDPKYIRKLKSDGHKLLEAYLDLTLSDVRLRAVESVVVACACVVCVRAALGVGAWPGGLGPGNLAGGAARTGVVPLASLLLRMMQARTSKDRNSEEVDQGYGSARTSPIQTPSASPSSQPAHPVLDLCDVSPPSPPAPLPSPYLNWVVNSHDPNDYSFYRCHRLLEAGQSVPQRAVKRSAPGRDSHSERKRLCLADQLSQVSL